MQNRHAATLSQTGPNFAAPVATDGYAWWYVDALSECGRYGVTVIAMLGCVFSPWYAAARRRGPADPLQHPAINVALYGAAGHRWALTERGRADVQRDTTRLQIGPSSILWHQGALQIVVNEITSPWPSRLRGTITVRPNFTLHETHVLDAHGRHRWAPIATSSPVELDFEQPKLRWRGTAYFDSNEGDAPLERDFDSWHWSRATRNGTTKIFYDTNWTTRGSKMTRDISESGNSRHGRSIGLQVSSSGLCTPLVAPPYCELPTTGWGIRRRSRCDAGVGGSVIDTLENGPFYARSLLRLPLDGADWTAFHESVSLRRFAARWVQWLLPVKLPRRVLRRV